jgi:hypothetical protein
VNNALVDDLMDPSQGVCRVCLDFDHNLTDELTMVLTAPSGDAITLIGNATYPGSVIRPFAQSHQVCFIPSMDSVPMPDFPLDNRWSNGDWIIDDDNLIDGKYLPAMGNLGDFGGNVEGIWELIITDEFGDNALPALGSASMNSFAIEFCESQLECEACEAQAGSFMLDTLLYCTGSQAANSLSYTSVQSNTLRYTEGFVVYEDGMAIRFEPDPGLESLLDTGYFHVYGVSVDRSDVMVVERREIKSDVARDTVLLGCDLQSVDLNGGSSVLGFNSQFTWMNEQGATVSSDSITSVISPGLYTLIVSEDFTAGISPGLYTLIVSEDFTAGTCSDSSFVLVESAADTFLFEIDATIDTLDCLNTESILSFETNAPIGSHVWEPLEEPFGSNLTSNRVTQPGKFLLTIFTDSTSSCVLMDSLIIERDVEIPDLMPVSDTLTCTTNVAILDFSMSYEKEASSVLIAVM